MKKNIFIAAIFVSSVGLISSTLVSTEGDPHDVMKSGGGPANNTNAPGEKTCSGAEGTSACHSGGIPDNSGPATTLISSSGGMMYVPGQTYTITCSITHQSRTRFGFQCTARRLSNNSVGGNITVTDATNTWLHPATFANCTSCQYICHKLAGSYFTSTTGSWTFSWTAPSSNIGNIRMYACFNAVNNNNTNDNGDETYYSTLTLTPSMTGIDEQSIFSSSVNIFPSPSGGEFTISTEGINASKAFTIYNVQGKEVDKISSSSESTEVNLSKQPKGLYFIKVSCDKKTAVKKVVIE